MFHVLKGSPDFPFRRAAAYHRVEHALFGGIETISPCLRMYLYHWGFRSFHGKQQEVERVLDHG